MLLHRGYVSATVSIRKRKKKDGRFLQACLQVSVRNTHVALADVIKLWIMVFDVFLIQAHFLDGVTPAVLVRQNTGHAQMQYPGR